MIVLIGIWVVFMRRQSNGMGSTMGKSRHKMLNEEQTKVTFEDVAGCDEGKG